MDPTNRNTALASAFAEELARSGMRHAVVSPGSRSTPLALALWRHPEIDVTVIVDERSAGFFALGAAQASGRPVAVACTSGTAAANLHPAVCEADESAVPLLALTADRPPELRDVGAGQTIDQLALYGSAVRWFCEVGTHEADDAGLLHLRGVACRAFAAAAGDPRPGPVHLNLSWRDPLGPAPGGSEVTASSRLAREGREGRPLISVLAGPPAPWPELLDALADRIAASRRGVILAGRLDDPGAPAALAALAERTAFPILAEPTSGLRLGRHDRSRVISHYDPIARLESPGLAPDLVLRFGELPTSKALRTWVAALGEVPQLAFDPRWGWHEPTRVAGAIVRVDATDVARTLAERLAAPDVEEGWDERWASADRAAADAIDAELAGEGLPTEPGFWRALGASLRDGELVYTASSMPIRDQEAYLRSGGADVRFLANRGANGIDGLVSSGAGAAHASGRPTVIVVGDLGLLHDLGGLAVLSVTSAPVRVVVLDNGGGAIFDFLPQADQLRREEFESLLATPRPVSAERAAALFELPFTRIEELEALPSALAGGTGVLELRAGREQNLELHRRLAERAAAAVAATLETEPA